MKYLVLGGTGTLGKAIVRRLLCEYEPQIICLSRCELKQKEMQVEFKNDKRLSFKLGDIRDVNTLYSAAQDVNTIFHVAALKHIEVSEENPEESIKTNIQGTLNVADVAYQAGVKHVIFSSTDKAVDPINVYGMCKGISEKLLLRRNEIQTRTRFSVYRWGNVLASRGSVIKSFVDSLKQDHRVSITHPDMTRFWIRIEDAVDFIFKTYPTDPGNEVLIPPIKTASLSSLVAVLADIIGVNDYSVNYTGLRLGEKVHENLRSLHTPYPLDSKTSPSYSMPELRDLLTDTLYKIQGTV